MPRTANKGSFKPGPDPRRHVFTRKERRKGYKRAMAHGDVHVVAWVFRRVRGYYRACKQAREGETK